MSREHGDTTERSLAHWDEAARAEMDAFYRVATQDYRELVQDWDWDGFLRRCFEKREPVRILDVACGSGKFPAALRRYTRLGELGAGALRLDLLDPSVFSLNEARASLSDPAGPMVAGQSFECTLQALPSDAGNYDVVWAVHALYALPESELDEGVEAFLRALGSEGLGFVAQATRRAHYSAFYEAYLKSRRPEGTPYTSGEAVAEAFRRGGAKVEVRRLSYEQVIDDEVVLEGFLQRCVFDAELSLEEMQRDPVLGAYLESCRETKDRWRFHQEVEQVFIRR